MLTNACVCLLVPAIVLDVRRKLPATPRATGTRLGILADAEHLVTRVRGRTHVTPAVHGDQTQGETQREERGHAARQTIPELGHHSLRTLVCMWFPCEAERIQGLFPGEPNYEDRPCIL